MSGWRKLGWASIFLSILWIFVVPTFFEGGHYAHADWFVLNEGGLPWLVVLGILGFLFIVSLYKSEKFACIRDMRNEIDELKGGSEDEG